MSEETIQTLLDEILQLIHTGRILNPTHSAPAGIVVVSDLDRAIQDAWTQTYAPDERTWTDIREREVAHLKGKIYGTPEYHALNRQVEAARQALLRALDAKLSPRYEDLIDDMDADLSNCILSRVVLGTQSRFFEMMFEIYRSGGWPCGWEGSYPTGTMRAFFP